MDHRSNRKRKLRAPFIVTFAATAAAALLPACGARVIEDDCGDGGAGSGRAECSDPRPDARPDAPPAVCPASAPRAGDACTDQGLHCSYGSCARNDLREATCDPSGVWRVGVATCNPPPPPDPNCPAAAPAQGASCYHAPTLNCTYGTCYGQPTMYARCDLGTRTWQVSISTCNPPPPPRECPATAPAPGTLCNVDPAERCGYDDCYGRPATVATCDATTRTWQVSRSSCNPPRPMCPPSQPADGDPCPYVVAVSCNYGDCAGFPTATARCDTTTRTWRVAVATCNPPPPDAGAHDAGSAGD